ncbi:MAG: hypothetical protein ACREXX_15395, partial [Gammaproteobacteria bacterium]
SIGILHSRVLGGSRLGVSRWTPSNVKLLLPPRQSRGFSHHNNLSGVFTSQNDQPTLKPGEAVYFYGGRAAIYNALDGYDWAILKSPSGVKTYMYRTVIKMKTFGKKQVFMFTPYDEAFHKLLTNFWDIDNRGIIGDYGVKMGEFRTLLKKELEAAGKTVNDDDA